MFAIVDMGNTVDLVEMLNMITVIMMINWGLAGPTTVQAKAGLPRYLACFIKNYSENQPL